MKKHVIDFCKQGMVAAWGGPVIVALIYAVLGAQGVLVTLTVKEVCMAILSSTVMTFIAAGIRVVYRVEQLPLPMAILIHCAVLYLDYLLVYLMNGWLPNQQGPIMTFTLIFVAGFALIWLFIYQFTKKDIKKLNQKLKTM